MRTVLAFGVAVALYFLPYVANKAVFLPVVIIACLIPQIGTLSWKKTGMFAKSDKLSFIDKILKNYTICIIVSIGLAFSYPVLALPFFLGYSFTVSLNAFSKEGVEPFWPIVNTRTSGRIVSGGSLDNTLFYIFIVFDVALLVKFFF